MLPERYEYDLDQPGGLSPTTTDRDWWALARCNDLAGTMSSLFFSEELQDISMAKQICARCPVMAQCLEGAIDRREPWGVWGGQLMLNGKVLQSKRRRGRPPKVARLEDQLPEIPVPEHLRERIVYKSA
jgi:WhiB family transcriptional regulator, redox-sensing transcriptional regulator